MRLVRRLATCLLLAALVVGTTSCIGYVARGAYNQFKILAAREKLDSVIADKETPEHLRKNLLLAIRALKFADSIGLKSKGAYRTYVHLNKDSLSWVLMAARKTSFEIKSWWFPVVGTVPYRGYFSKEDAAREAERLSTSGYETLVRPSAAFSSLGWFNDPLLSTFTDGDAAELVETIFHELLHRNIWVKGDVVKNESVANFVGIEASVDFFNSLVDTEVVGWSGEEIKALQKRAELTRAAGYRFGDALTKLYDDLNRLYQSSLTEAEKLEIREAIFQADAAKLPKFSRTNGGFERLNNAEIMQSRIYYTDLGRYKQQFESIKRDWRRFFKELRSK